MILSRILLSVAAATAATAMSAQGAEVVTLPMDIEGNTLRGRDITLQIEGNFAPMQIAGREGKAWRTDGNSSRATGRLGRVIDGTRMSATLRFATDTYAIIEHETGTTRFVEVASCLDDSARTGFGFFMNRTGSYMARVYVGGSAVEITAADRIPLWEWTDLTLTVDGTQVSLYRNGELKGRATAQTEGVRAGESTLYLGRANAHGDIGGTETCAFNGAFDSLTIRDDVYVEPYGPAYADLNLPTDRYAADRMRARFHGQPGMNWTNETHGLFHNASGDGKWHAFFQRTGSTPMMSHQHWGHIVSDDLVTWRDEKPALAPSEPYDIKGCWSGCVFSDKAFNGGSPTIIYTGVDFARPYAATAYCDDPQTMRDWHKASDNPVYVTENCGDARDTYFYRTDADNAYFLIGARDAVHYYRWSGSRWEYKGEFYHTEEGVDNGHNTEMPNVTRIGDKWVMTTSPLAGRYGTACLYRTGNLTDGRFTDYSQAERVDFFGCDGYGLLSPSPAVTPDGKVIALGIVPDKLPGQLNIRHGYAHLYSLPREWSLDAEGRLMQKAYEGITEYRNHDLFMTESGLTLDDTLDINPVRGREAEIRATFTLGDGKAGINFFKNSRGNCASLSYDPATREISIDYSRIAHYDNGRDRFASVLPLGPGRGEELTLHLIIDHSITDIFVNDRYAASVRIFPEDDDADKIEIFSESPCTLVSLEAYVLGDGDMSTAPVEPEFPAETLESTGKVALYAGYLNEEDLMADPSAKEEKATYAYFREAFPGGTVLFSGDKGKIDPTDFDMVWINCDRRDMARGWENLPEGYSDPELIEILRRYTSTGGNLYLTKMASQLVVAIGRISDPGDALTWSNGAGDIKDDCWEMNVRHYGNDWSAVHPVLSGLDFHEEGDRMNLTLMSGRHRREDHNCMWELPRLGGHDGFCADNNARVIGTWGHDGGQTHAGLIEFMPLRDTETPARSVSASAADARRGTVIVNGLAAYEWDPTEGSNASRSNIESLTHNVICYLSPVRDIETGADTAIESDDDTAVYYTLPGIKVADPRGGIFIEVRGGKTRKVAL